MLPRVITLLVLVAGLCGGGSANEVEHGLPTGKAGLAAKYPGDVGIERHKSVIFASGFENGFTGWSRHNPKVSTIIKDPKIVHSGKACCQTTATRGRDTGGTVLFNLPKGIDQLYLRFYCRFHKDTVMPHHFVKIRARHKNYWSGAGNRPRGDKAFWTGIEPTRARTWHFYTYWYKMHSWRRDPRGRPRSYYGNTFNPDGQKPFERDKWICVEAMLKVNTVGKSDGEQAFWIDGEKIGHWKPGSPVGTWSRDKFQTSGRWNTNPIPFDGFDFRSDASVFINEVLLQWYVSNRVNRDAKTDRNIVYFDDVVIATEYIGPMAKHQPQN